MREMQPSLGPCIETHCNMGDSIPTRPVVSAVLRDKRHNNNKNKTLTCDGGVATLPFHLRSALR